MRKYQRRPAVVEAVQWKEGVEIEGVKRTAPERGSIIPRAILRVPHGTFLVNQGDYIVTGPGGRRWVVESGVFHALYAPYHEPTPHELGEDDPDIHGY